MSNNLDKFRFYCQDYPAPDLFIEADFLFLIASALGRRVWTGEESENFTIFPNQFVIKVAPPGIGKSSSSGTISNIIELALESRIDYQGRLIDKIPMIKVLPSTTSLEKLYVRLSTGCSTNTPYRKQDGNFVKYYVHTSIVYLLRGELDILLRENKSQDIVTFLTECWEGVDHKYDTIKHGERKIHRPCLSFTGNATREKMKRLTRTGILNEGLAARFVFFCADKAREGKPQYKFTYTEDELRCKRDLVSHIELLASLPAGPLTVKEDAMEYLVHYLDNVMLKERNPSPALDNYYTRKKIHAIKYAIAYHFADKFTPEIELIDVERSINLLRQAELTMGSAFWYNGKNIVYNCGEEIKIIIGQKGCAWIDLFRKLLPDYEEDIIKKALRLVEKLDGVYMGEDKIYRLNGLVKEISGESIEEPTKELKPEDAVIEIE